MRYILHSPSGSGRRPRVSVTAGGGQSANRSGRIRDSRQTYQAGTQGIQLVSPLPGAEWTLPRAISPTRVSAH